MSIQEIKRKTEAVLRKHGVRRAAVFGSAARGELRPESDVDILVDMQDDASLLDVIELKQELQEALQRDVDIVEYDTIKPTLRESILEQQVPLV
jgi:predicted nucleotidyltransferase